MGDKGGKKDRNQSQQQLATKQKDTEQRKMPDGIEGQISELCRDLAVEVKRMRQLQMQAEELRLVVHQWSAGASRTPGRDSI